MNLWKVWKWYILVTGTLTLLNMLLVLVVGAGVAVVGAIVMKYVAITGMVLVAVTGAILVKRMAQWCWGTVQEKRRWRD